METKEFNGKAFIDYSFDIVPYHPEILKFDGGDIFGEKYRGITMSAPRDFVFASPEEREEVYNGIGPGWAPEFTRDLFERAWGLDISPAGYIHDWGYCRPDSLNLNYKLLIDKVFKRVFRAIVRAKSPWYLRYVRLLRAEWQFLAVKYGGNSSFLHGKRGNK